MNLKLNKPLAFFDLETTGLNVANDRIVEISIVKIMPNGDKEIKTKLLNPTIPISKESSSIHGYTDEDVKDKATFKEVAKEIADFIEDCDLAGYNSNKFDIPLLAEEFLRVNIEFDISKRKLIDVQNIFHKMEKRTLEAAYQFYCGKELTNAHSAEADTTATFEILDAQIAKYDNLKADTNFLSDFSQMNKNADLMGRFVYNKNEEVVFNFGKHKGKTVIEVLKKEPGYYHWMMNGDFPLYTKKVLKNIKEKMGNSNSLPTNKTTTPKKTVNKQVNKEVDNKEVDNKEVSEDLLNQLKTKFNS